MGVRRATGGSPESPPVDRKASMTVVEGIPVPRTVCGAAVVTTATVGGAVIATPVSFASTRASWMLEERGGSVVVVRERGAVGGKGTELPLPDPCPVVSAHVLTVEVEVGVVALISNGEMKVLWDKQTISRGLPSYTLNLVGDCGRRRVSEDVRDLTASFREK
jgi:hypothetical protein